MAYLSDKESAALKDNNEKAAIEWGNLQKDFFLIISINGSLAFG